MNKKNILKLLKLAFGLGVIVFLFSKTSVREFVQLLTHANYVYFILSIILYILGQIICTKKWMVISEKLNFDYPFVNYLRWYFLGMFYNTFLPTNIGGDVVKIAKMNDGKDFGLKRAVISVLTDRITGLYVLIFFILLGAIFFHSEFFVNILNFSIVFSGVVGLVIFAYFVKHKDLIPDKYEEIYNFVTGLFEKKCVVRIILLSLVFHIFVIFIHCFIASMYNISLPFSFYLILYSITAIISSLPVSINGIGIKEFAYVYLLKLFSIDTSTGILFSMTFSMVVLFSSMLGFLPYVSSRERK